MQPIQVHHVALNVSDVDEAIRFYTDVLGFTVREDRPDFGFAGAWLQAGDAQVHLLQSDTTPAAGQHFALQFGDLGAVVAELRGRGIEVGDPIPVNANLQTFVFDPSGNMIELHQVGALAPA
jgi:glyoxylase I family protein